MCSKLIKELCNESDANSVIRNIQKNRELMAGVEGTKKDEEFEYKTDKEHDARIEDINKRYNEIVEPYEERAARMKDFEKELAARMENINKERDASMKAIIEKYNKMLKPYNTRRKLNKESAAHVEKIRKEHAARMENINKEHDARMKDIKQELAARMKDFDEERAARMKDFDEKRTARMEDINKRYNEIIKSVKGTGLKSNRNEKVVNNKYYVNDKLLKDHGILEIRYVKNRHLAHVKPPMLSEKCKRCVISMIDGRKIDADHFVTLNQFEKDLVRKVDKLFNSGQNLHDDDDDNFSKNFEILKGSYLAGSDSQMVKQQLREYINHAHDIGKINRHQRDKILFQIKLV